MEARLVFDAGMLLLDSALVPTRKAGLQSGKQRRSRAQSESKDLRKSWVSWALERRTHRLWGCSRYPAVSNDEFSATPPLQTPTGFGGTASKSVRAHVCRRGGGELQAVKLKRLIRMHGQKLTWT
jgi:hypothetical protein